MISPSNLPSPAGYSFGSYGSLGNGAPEHIHHTQSKQLQQPVDANGHINNNNNSNNRLSTSTSSSSTSQPASLLEKSLAPCAASMTTTTTTQTTTTTASTASSLLNSNQTSSSPSSSSSSAATAMTPSTTFQKSAPASSLSVALCRSVFLKYIYMTYLFFLQLLALPSAAFQRFVRRRRSGLSLDSKKNDNSVDNGSGGVLVGAVGEKFVQQYTLDNHLNTSTASSINNSINNSSNNNGNSMLRRSSRFKSRSDLEEIAQSSTMSLSDPTLQLSSTSSSTLTPSSRYAAAAASVGSGGAGTLTPRNSSTFSHAGYGTDSMAEDGSGDNSTTRGNNVRLRQRMGRPMSGLSSGYHGAGAGGMGARKKTLVLDLDETLIHSTSRGSRSQGYMVEVLVDRHACLYYVYKRPHVDYFLKKVSEWYKLVIFTASMAEYADPVIDWLDQSKTLFDKRYFRQACFLRNGSYLKDLTVIDPDLSSVCLLDNSPMSYSLNKENGIPIDTWIDDPNDEALLDLLPFLDALRFTEDVRSVLSLRTV